MADRSRMNGLGLKTSTKPAGGAVELVLTQDLGGEAAYAKTQAKDPAPSAQAHERESVKPYPDGQAIPDAKEPIPAQVLAALPEGARDVLP